MFTRWRVDKLRGPAHGSAAAPGRRRTRRIFGDLFFETIKIAEALSAELTPHSARGWAGLPAHPLDYHHDDRGLADTSKWREAERLEMIRYIIGRLLWIIPVLFVVTVITFALMHAVPGGPWAREKAGAGGDRGARSTSSTALTTLSRSNTSAG